MKNKKIMIIDDEQHMLFLSKAIVSSHGYEVITESNSQKAFATIIEQKPALILLDLVMPGINGIELAQKIKATAELKNIPLFAFTGTPDVLNEKNSQYFEKILIKPFHMEDLIKEINLLFKSK